jgi:putative acetyltransferase
MPETRIRTAIEDDAPAIASVIRASFEEYRTLYTPEAFDATTPGSTEIALRMKEGPVWFAASGNRVVGTVSGVPKGSALYVRSMAVLPAARGIGVGRLLLRHVENFALSSGYKQMILSTTPFLKSAIRLYESYGFHVTADGPYELFGTSLFTMVKELNISAIK